MFGFAAVLLLYIVTVVNDKDIPTYDKIFLLKDKGQIVLLTKKVQ